jgi:hypothetical protein
VLGDCHGRLLGTAQRHHGDVVEGLRLADVRIELGIELGEQPPCVQFARPGQHRPHPLLRVELAVRVLCLGHPVGVEEEQVAELELGPADPERRAGHHAQRGPGRHQGDLLAVAPAQHGRVVPAVDVDHRTGRRVQQPEEQRREVTLPEVVLYQVVVRPDHRVEQRSDARGRRGRL